MMDKTQRNEVHFLHLMFLLNCRFFCALLSKLTDTHGGSLTSLNAPRRAGSFFRTLHCFEAACCFMTISNGDQCFCDPRSQRAPRFAFDNHEYNIFIHLPETGNWMKMWRSGMGSFQGVGSIESWSQRVDPSRINRQAEVLWSLCQCTLS